MADKPNTGAPAVPSAVVAWRFEELLRFGYPLDVAESVANSRVDIHRLKDLIDSGCERRLALRILR